MTASTAVWLRLARPLDDHDHQRRHDDLHRPEHSTTTEDRVIGAGRYHGSVANANRISDSLTGYDNLGRVYQTTVYRRRSGDGRRELRLAGLQHLVDAAGNVIETQAGGTQEFTKTAYDGLGSAHGRVRRFRPQRRPIDLPPPGASRGDTILQQTEHAIRRRGRRDVRNHLRPL